MIPENTNRVMDLVDKLSFTDLIIVFIRVNWAVFVDIAPWIVILLIIIIILILTYAKFVGD